MIFQKMNLKVLNIFVNQQYPKSKKQWFSYITEISFIKKTIQYNLKTKPDIICI